MTANINLETGVAYGYVSANKLNSDVVAELLDNGTDHAAQEAYQEWLDEQAQRMIDNEEFTEEQREEARADAEGMSHEFWEEYQCDEPTVEGTKDGVTYRSSWLGGVLNFFIFHSPYVTHNARECSPCVPNAGNLDDLTGDYTCYDVPDSWYRVDE